MEKSLKTWNFRTVGAVYLMTLMASYLFLPCLCATGIIKLTAASIIFILIGLRILLAYQRKEQNNDWKIYIAFMFISPICIEFLLGH